MWNLLSEVSNCYFTGYASIFIFFPTIILSTIFVFFSTAAAAAAAVWAVGHHYFVCILESPPCTSICFLLSFSFSFFLFFPLSPILSAMNSY